MKKIINFILPQLKQALEPFKDKYFIFTMLNLLGVISRGIVLVTVYYGLGLLLLLSLFLLNTLWFTITLIIIILGFIGTYFEGNRYYLKPHKVKLPNREDEIDWYIPYCKYTNVRKSNLLDLW